MQNYNNPMQPPPPQGGYGAPPPPPAKKGMSTGIKILIIGVVGVVICGVVLVIAGIGGVYWLSRRSQQVATTTGRPMLSGLTGASGADAKPPEPTEAQQAAIAGGQTAAWEQQEITWTVPQKWKKSSAESTTFMWRSPGSWDAASLIVSISPMSADFPTETSIAAFYAGAEQRKRNGEVDEVRWLKLGGLKGVMFRESAPESDDNPQRLQWMGYRDYKGQKQLVNIMLASRGKDFARHEDAMYGILYSTNLGQ
ncbi:MAG: hypothetical protein QOE46_370 [Acidobacteriota bacterium]|jgi:hypothetical protein|nr:hypothetical protein [Acidobacteriota bacterium]